VSSVPGRFQRFSESGLKRWSSRSQRAAATALAAVAAVSALFGGERPKTVVVLVDVSRSTSLDPAAHRGEVVAELERHAAAVGLRVVAFGRDVHVADASDGMTDAELDALLRAPDPRGSNLAAALREAVATVPDAHDGEFLVLSDGRDTSGNVPSALALARSRGIGVVARSPSASESRVRVVEVVAPPQARPGERIPVEVVLSGMRRGALDVFLEERTGGTVQKRNVTVRGTSRVVFPLSVSAPGLERFRAWVSTEPDRIVETGTDVSGGAAVLVLGSDLQDDGDWRAVVDSVAGGRAVTRASGTAAVAPVLEGREPGTVDLVILDDLPEHALGPDGGERLRRAVAGGLGLAVIGGPNTLGAGGYAHRPLEQALPVRCAPSRQAPLLILAMDLSGSMAGAADEGGTRAAALRVAAGEFIDSAPRDARLVLAPFNDRLLASLAAFDLSDDGERSEARRTAAEAHEPGGGTRFGAAVDVALDAASKATRGSKVLLMVTDGRPAETVEELKRQGRRLAAADIRTIVVPLTRDVDGPRLDAFVESAGGRRLAAEDRKSASAIAAGLLTALSDQAPWTWNASPTRAVPAVDPPWGRVPAGLPMVAAFNPVEGKADSVTWLATPDGSPLVAAGRHGAGRASVIAFSPRSGSWSSDSAARWLRKVLEWTRRPAGERGVTLRARRLLEGGVRVTVEREPDAPGPDRVHVKEHELRRIAPGRWSGEVEAGAMDGDRLSVLADGRPLGTVPVFEAPLEEDRHLGTDTDALEALTLSRGAAGSGRGGAGIPSVLAAFAAMLLLLSAALTDQRAATEGPSVQAGGLASQGRRRT
jgi:hypothetical protein